MKMLMPSNVRAVKQYRDGQPLFSRMGVESQLDAMFSPTVQLRSGGYIVINQTEALVSIDVNSGRATREHHIEDTALKTNLEAAEEVARQLRLRDLAGLIVIDFIDMDEKRNNRAVERKLSDCLRQDRARIQVGRISHFGLLEMSRQRIRASVLESSTEPCPQCGGTGHVRSVSSVALQLLRGIEEILMKGATHNLVVRTRTDVALYVLNHKRGHLRDLENAFKVTLSVVADPTVSGQQSFIIERGEQVHTLEAAKALLGGAGGRLAAADRGGVRRGRAVRSRNRIRSGNGRNRGPCRRSCRCGGKRGRRRTGGPAPQAAPAPARPWRRSTRSWTCTRGRMLCTEDEGARIEAAPIADIQSEDGEADEDDTEEQPIVARTDQGGGERRPRRRGRRGGRRRRGGPDDGLAGSIADELAPPSMPEAESAVADFDGFSSESSPPIAQGEVLGQQPQMQPSDNGQSSGHDQPSEHSQHETTHASAQEEAAQEAEKAARRRSTVREKVSFLVNAQPEAAAPVNLSPEPAPAPAVPPPPRPKSTPEAASDNQPRRAGWWSRRFGNGE